MDISFQAVWPYVVAFLTTIVVPLFVTGDNPIGAVRIINYLKVQLGASGHFARALTVLVSTVLALILYVVDGQLDAFVTGEAVYTVDALSPPLSPCSA
jgi:peptidoglycan/LPS O-acetylase OafA/YrhL